MAIQITSRSRRTATQIRALASVEPEIRASDKTWRRKYLQEYTQAFRSYESVLGSVELEAKINAASIVLVGDYHALPACQKYVAELLKDQAKKKNRPIVLAVETVFSRDQHIVDEWWNEDICEQEIRRRIRFDLDWGYDWDPFYELLLTARQHAVAVFGLDCMPREDLRKIGIRDRHAAHKIAEIRERHPDAVIVVLIGESHLAPSHLPALVGKQLPRENVISVLQNVDALYWRACREEDNDPQAVRINENTVCVFNSTPLEKYESYRLCLDRWRGKQDEETDFAPVIYKLIDQLLRFLDIDRYSPRNGKQPKFLIDSLPEVYDPSTAEFRKLLVRHKLTDETSKTIFQQLEERGSLYWPQFNTFVARELRIDVAAEEAARFVHYACQGRLPHDRETADKENKLHSEIIEHALVFLGAQILCQTEMSTRSQRPSPESTDAARSSDNLPSSQAAGRVLGATLYGAHLSGDLIRTDLKRLFLFSVKQPEKATELYSQLRKRLHLVL
ncbi:MAG: ChaN family lipoprotein [Terriglobales bacterium]